MSSDIFYTEQEALALGFKPMGFVPKSVEEDDVEKKDTSIFFTEEEIAQQKTAKQQTEELIRKQRVTTEDILEKEPISAEPVSVKSLYEDEQFIEDILQYRKDRFGVEKDVGSSNILFGYALGEYELTPENIVDDYMDHWRFITNNSMDAAMEYSWLESLTAKEEDIKAEMAKATGNTLQKLTEQANNISEMKARALRLYKRADNVAGFFDSKRFEGMDAFEVIGDIAETTGTNILAGLSDPMTVITAGVGRVIGGAAASAGVSPFKSAIIAAATTAPIEAGGAAATDIVIQTAEIEMGAREEIDYERTAAVAGVAALISGTVTYRGTKKTASRVDKATKGELTDALKKVQKEQTELAQIKNAELGVQSDQIRERLAKNIEKTYGKEAIIRNEDGIVKSINSKFLRESEGAKKVAAELEFDEELYQPALSLSTFERVTASVGEIIEEVRAGKIKINETKLPSGLKQSDLVSKLQKDETVSERLINILTSTSKESFNATTGILGKYGVTQRELAATMFADASRAGQILNRLSRLSKVVSRAARDKTEDQVRAEAEDLAVRNLGNTFRRLEDIRRLTLVSGVATAVRNNLSQVIRSGVDTLVYGLESGLHSVAGTGRKKFGIRSMIAQLEHTFYDPKDAATISQFLLELNPEQRARFFNQFSEVVNPLNKNNPAQAALSKQSNGLQTQTPILDKWEAVINWANGLNRYQEAIYRQGMFTASIQRQLFDNGLDMMDVLKSGRISENISQDMVAKAVDDALDFTYANQPEWGLFRTLNSMIVQSGATLAIPFPRFMFKAMEMTYNYNFTGVLHGMQKIIRSKMAGDIAPDREIRRVAEGLAGGAPLLALGYTLRDPDGNTAGSEWYMLKDGKGNEFDARPFFPLTPYLLFGEMIHRYTDERYAGEVFEWKEAFEGLTGANFRGTGAASTMLEDFFAAGTDSSTEMEFNLTLKELGVYLGEALSGYGQPIYQFADVFADSNQRLRDYKSDLDSGGQEGYIRNLRSFFSGVWEPFESRIGRLLESGGISQENVPFKEDPRFPDVPERVVPFMKILFGASLNRVPPQYIQDLSRYGFTYVDFMSKTNSPDVDRFVNREMGILMNREMPEAIATVRKIFPDNGDAQASLLKEYISDMKSGLYAQIKTAEEDTILNSLIQRYLRMSPYHRRAAVRKWKEDTGKEPDLKNPETVSMLIEWGSAAKFLAEQR